MNNIQSIPYSAFGQLPLLAAYHLYKEIKQGYFASQKLDNSHRSLFHCAILPQMRPLCEALNHQLKGRRILDIGCGSRTPNRDTLSRDPVFEPWLCRALHAYGAHMIGVDEGILADEPFEHYEINLLKPNSLSMIPDHSVDCANASMLFDSPFLMVQNGYHPNTFKKSLEQQLQRIIKPGGAFIYSDHDHLLE